MNKPAVSIVRCRQTDDFESVKSAVSESLELIGGLGKVISHGDSVVVKPNLVVPADYRTGIVTNPFVVKALCELARDAGAKKVTIAESSGVWEETEKAFEKSGIKQVAEELKVDLLDLKKAETLNLPVPQGVILKRLKVPRIIREADVIINVPVIKTHNGFPATLGLKNMKGILQDTDKKRFHNTGLAQCIVDLNKLVLPAVTVLDGTVGMEGLGPVNGTPVNLGVIISSFDTVAGDVVAGMVMGIPPEEIEYIVLAGSQGLGECRLDNIEVKGLSIDEVKRPFKRIVLNAAECRKRGIEIYEAGACSGCKHLMEHLIIELEKDGRLDLIRPYAFILGLDVKIPADYRRNLIGLGACAKRYMKGKKGHIPGCPPHPEDVLAFFDKKGRVNE
jgi:uncharacterized protein (DUF362 family)